jgi:hypothetical protein
MRIRALSAFVGVVLTALVLSAGAEGASSSGAYSAYVACGVGAQAKPAHKCKRGDEVGAFFKSVDPVQFTLCVKFPGGRRLCAQDQSAEAGELKINTVTTNKLGRHKLTWHVGNHKIVRYFRLTRN